MWSKALTVIEMKKFTTDCEIPTLKSNLIDWKELNIIETGNQAKWVELQTNAICKDKTGENNQAILVIPVKQSYLKSKATCELLGGRFPVATNIEELANLKSSINLNVHNDMENVTSNRAKYCQLWKSQVVIPNNINASG